MSYVLCEARDLALNSATITVAWCPLYLGDAENGIVIVKIYDAPDKMPDTVIIGHLSAYGHVLAFRRNQLASEKGIQHLNKT